MIWRGVRRRVGFAVLLALPACRRGPPSLCAFRLATTLNGTVVHSTADVRPRGSVPDCIRVTGRSVSLYITPFDRTYEINGLVEGNHLLLRGKPASEAAFPATIEGFVLKGETAVLTTMPRPCVEDDGCIAGEGPISSEYRCTPETSPDDFVNCLEGEGGKSNPE